MKKKASSKKARPSKRRASSKPRELTPKQRKARAAKGWVTRKAKLLASPAGLETLVLKHGKVGKNEGWQLKSMTQEGIKAAMQGSLTASGLDNAKQGIQSNGAPNMPDRFRHVDFAGHRAEIERAILNGGDVEQTLRVIASDGAIVGQNEASKLMHERHDMTIVFGLCNEVRAHGGSNANGVWTLADYVVQAVTRVLRRDVLHERGGVSQAA